MRINTDLLRKVLEHIKKYPATWRQMSWVSLPLDGGCGTAFCFAGHAAHMSGFTPHPRRVSWTYLSELPEEIATAFRQWAPIHARDFELLPNSQIHISVMAEAVLGLSRNQGLLLFEGDNSLETLEAIVNNLIAKQEAIDAREIERGRALEEAAREVVSTAEAIVEEALTEPAAV